MLFIMGIMVWAACVDPEETPPLPLLVVLFGIPAGCIIGTLKVLVDRLKEIGRKKKMLIVTINEVPGKKIEALGVVGQHRAEPQPWPRHHGRVPYPCGRRKSNDYAEMLTEARQIATGRMAKNAEELGADAVVDALRPPPASCRVRQRSLLAERR